MIKTKDIPVELNLLKHKLKQLFKLKYQTVISLTGLIVAITVFIVISHIALFELSFDKFHQDYQDIYRVQNNRIYQNLNDESAGCPPATGPAIKEEIPEIIASARIKPLLNTLIEVIQAGKKTVQYHNNLFFVDNAVFEVFSFQFIAGNPGNALSEVNTAAVTRSFGLKYFGKENVLGEKFKCSGEEGVFEFTIKAVLENIPANSYLDMDCMLSYPTLIQQNSDAKNGWGWNAFNTFIRLKPNADTALVNNKLAQVVKKYNLSNENLTRIFQLQPLTSIHLHSNLRHEIGKRGNAFAVYILMVIAVFILLVAWINYINLSTAKSRKQILEIYIRQVLGSTKRQLAFEYIFETLILNIIAVNVSLILMELIEPALNTFLQTDLHPIGFANWIYLLLISVSVSVFAGLYATLQLYVKQSMSTQTITNIRKSSIFRNGLVVFQFTVSVIFIIVSILVIKQIDFLEEKQKELSLDHIITIRTLSDDNAANQSQKAFMDGISKLPGIINVSSSNAVPGGNYSNVIGAIRPFGVKEEDGIKCSFIDVNESFFDLYDLELIAGENFKNSSAKNTGNIIINALAAKMMGYDKPSDAINQNLILGEMDYQTRTVIGVIEDYHQKSLQEPIQPMIFNYLESGGFISVKYGEEINSTVITRLKDTWNRILPYQPFDYYFNDQYYAALYDKDRIFSRLVGLFAILIVFISCIGLYSLAQFAINKRIKEIGIRKVNGARVIEIMFMLNKDFTMWVAVAFCIACPFAWYAMHLWLRNFAYQTEMSWWAFVGAGVISLTIALLTVSWQAYRAANRNPVEALRYE